MDGERCAHSNLITCVAAVAVVSGVGVGNAGVVGVVEGMCLVSRSCACRARPVSPRLRLAPCTCEKK